MTQLEKAKEIHKCESIAYKKLESYCPSDLLQYGADDCPIDFYEECSEEECKKCWAKKYKGKY